MTNCFLCFPSPSASPSPRKAPGSPLEVGASVSQALGSVGHPRGAATHEGDGAPGLAAHGLPTGRPYDPGCGSFLLQGWGLACPGLLISVLWLPRPIPQTGGLEQQRRVLSQFWGREGPDPSACPRCHTPTEAPGPVPAASPSSLWPQASLGTIHPCSLGIIPPHTSHRPPPVRTPVLPDAGLLRVTAS